MIEKTKIEYKEQLKSLCKITIKNDETPINKRINEGKLDRFITTYEELRKSLKNYISEEDFLIDKHKIAAAMLVIVCQISPIEWDTEIQDEKSFRKDQLIFLNFLTGYYLARSIISSFSGIKIIEPSTNGDKTYFDHIFTLYYHILKQFLENTKSSSYKPEMVLVLSHILFLLEKTTSPQKNQ